VFHEHESFRNSEEQLMHKYLLTLVTTAGLTAAVFAETITVTVSGTACVLCESGIEKIFRAQPEIKSVDADLENMVITLTTKPGRHLDTGKIVQLLKDTGYSVRAISRAE
jgi:copper chaperone CopZ